MLQRVERLVPPRLTMPLLAHYVRLRGERELGELGRWLRPGALALDIGANYGVWSWYMRFHGARVHAFEPNPELADRLRRAVPGITVHAVALSDTRGEAELRMPVREGRPVHFRATVEPANRFAGVPAETERRVRVPLERLDDLDLSDVCFVKIDVEGHELPVLRGGRRTLERWRPVILYEAEERHRPGTVAGCRAFLEELGYRVSPSVSPGMWLARHEGVRTDRERSAGPPGHR